MTDRPLISLTVRLIEIGNAAGEQVAKFQVINGTTTYVMPDVSAETALALKDAGELILTIAPADKTLE